MIARRGLLAGAAMLPFAAAAQEAPGGRRPGGGARPAGGGLPPLPATSVTHHSLDLPGRTLRFTATAGALPVLEASGEKLADVCYVAYALDGAAGPRPVTFAVNGGPGAASGWLQLGALGPWRVDMAHAVPSAPPALLPNGDTWLDFTDLVFLDPPGTGFSRAENDEAQKQLYSVLGDISALAVVIRRWMVANKRFGSPVYLVGESYGGFRAPKLTRALADDQGIGVRGMVLVSPALDLSARSESFDPLSWAVRLPVLVAAKRAQDGMVARGDLADAETYALGGYLSALLEGERDAAALADMEMRVAALTGLDRAEVARYGGRVGRVDVLREIDRRGGRIPSPYDTLDTVPDPFPTAVRSAVPDAVLDGLTAPVTGAMMTLYGTQLDWMVDAPYQLLNDSVAHNWEWGRGPEAVTALRQGLALDGQLHVLVAHGLFDMVTPWLYTSLLLDQIPGGAGAGRTKLVTYASGHMVYTADAARGGLRADALASVFG
jgi:carboxypeptidase C (cathepsin A)